MVRDRVSIDWVKPPCVLVYRYACLQSHRFVYSAGAIGMGTGCNIDARLETEAASCRRARAERKLLLLPLWQLLRLRR